MSTTLVLLLASAAAGRGQRRSRGSLLLEVGIDVNFARLLGTWKRAFSMTQWSGPSNFSIIRVTLNTESDTLQRSFFHAHAIEWIIVNVVLLESLFAKVRCIHLLRSLSWIFQQQT